MIGTIFEVIRIVFIAWIQFIDEFKVRSNACWNRRGERAIIKEEYNGDGMSARGRSSGGRSSGRSSRGSSRSSKISVRGGHGERVKW